MSIRNLSYKGGIVEQPIHNGVKLNKWIHNGIVVWENGKNDTYHYITICSNYSGGYNYQYGYIDMVEKELEIVSDLTNYYNASAWGKFVGYQFTRYSGHTEYPNSIFIIMTDGVKKEIVCDKEISWIKSVDNGFIYRATDNSIRLVEIDDNGNKTNDYELYNNPDFDTSADYDNVSSTTAICIERAYEPIGDYYYWKNLFITKDSAYIVETPEAFGKYWSFCNGYFYNWSSTYGNVYKVDYQGYEVKHITFEGVGHVNDYRMYYDSMYAKYIIWAGNDNIFSSDDGIDFYRINTQTKYTFTSADGTETSEVSTSEIANAIFGARYGSGVLVTGTYINMEKVNEIKGYFVFLIGNKNYIINSLFAEDENNIFFVN